MVGEVESISDKWFFVQFDEGDIIWNAMPERELTELGGISGCPCFVERSTPSGVRLFEWVGIVDSGNLQLPHVRIRYVDAIAPDGTITRRET